MNNYFPHDSNARNSDKLLPVRMKYGAEGYGIYFMLLERLREEKDYTSIKDYNMLAFDLRVDSGKLKSIIEDFGLFAFTDDGECFYSDSFKKRMEIKDAKSKKLSEAGRQGAEKRWNKSDQEGKPKGSYSHPIANATENDSKKRKGKETKVNESKVNNTAKETDKEKPQQSTDNISDAVPREKLALNTFQNNIGVLSPIVNEKIANWVKDFTDKGTDDLEANEIINHAIEIAVSKNARNWSYVNGILKSYYNSNLFTLANIQASEDEFKAKRQLNDRYNKPRVFEQGTEWSEKNREAEMSDKDADKMIAEANARLERLHT
ncbi:DnaD domain protein [Companilactobacillus sp. DQM5]|uniref:DnaD domain protein n=1 Tax=Companilactobacillus sp. DQM5 TaxID=3463359 RepID=UPI004058DF73